MHIKRLSRSFAGVALALLVVPAAACSGSSDTAKTATSSTKANVAPRGNVDGALALGQLAPLTGSLASISKSLTTPVRIAVDEINAAGGVNGKAVGLAVANDGGDDLPVARASLNTLLNTNKVDAIIGPTATGTALDLLDAIRLKGVLECSGSNSAEELSAADSGGYYFRTAPPDRLQALALARQVVAGGKKRPVIVVRDDTYGTTFAAPLVRTLRRDGATPAGDVIRYDPQTQDLTAVGREIASRHPDSVVVISLVDDGARLVNAMSAAGAGPNQIPVYTADGMQSTTFHTKVNPANPDAVRGILGTAPAAAPSGPDTPFTTALRKTGVAPIFSAHYYDCVILTALAAVKAHSDDPKKMKDAFAKNLRGTTDCSTFATCSQALAAGKTIHYRGASSPFDHWDGNEPGEGTYDVWSYSGTGSVVTGEPGYQIRVP
jgi:branched-chain amino acid transport system substrate-binding protein